MADQFYGLTDTGKRRDNNEDTFIAQVTADGKWILACVIDGVGGYSGGEVAAGLARKVILERLGEPEGEILLILTDCFNLVNQNILDEKKRIKEHASMACVATLALIDIEHNQFYYAHVGDTRLYLLRDSSLVKLSHDQSFVGFLEESGRLSEEEAMKHPNRNEINKALGFEADMAKDSAYIETGQSPFLPGDILLLCSDGLTDMANSAAITAIISRDGATLKEKCTELIATANAQGGEDNITVVLVKNDKQALQYEATRPAVNQKKNELPKLPVDPAPLPKKNTNWLVIILGVLTLVFLAGNLWQYLQRRNTTVVVAEAVVPARSALEVKLQNAINQVKGDSLLLTDTDYASPIKISRAIRIDRDTLFIKTKGKIELVADSGYTGAAFELAPGCKLVRLDSIRTFNFKAGIMSGNLQAFRADSLPVTLQHK